MDLYISQLVEDLYDAHQIEEEYDEENEETIIDIFEEAILFASGENHIEIYKLIGFIPEQFPPTLLLNLKQIRKVLKALTDLLWSYNIDTNFPPKLPDRLKYELLTEEMYKEIFVDKGGIMGLDYCEFVTETCPFGKKYCECKNINLELDEPPFPNDKSGIDDTDYPF
jgi:hypothetical protein